MHKLRSASIFGYRRWYTPIGSWISYLITAWALIQLAHGLVNPLWLFATLIGIFFMQMGVTVGMHRLFAHASFQCSRFWQIFLGYWATIGLYGTTIQWSGLHVYHHKHTDQDGDPMVKDWTYLLWKRNLHNLVHPKTLVRMWRDPLHRFLHNYYSLVVVFHILLLYLISPWLLIFGYVIPVAWYHWVTSWHNVLSHRPDRPKNLSAFEFIFFTGGEWGHLTHHSNAKSPKFDRFDAGYQFIKLIQK